MRALRAALAGAVAVAVLAPGAPVAAGESAPTPAGQPPEWLPDRPGGMHGRETPLEDLVLDAAREGRGRSRARSRALETFVRETWPGLDRAPEPDTEAEHAAAEAHSHTYTEGMPAGDLTGDGRADVLAVTWTWSGVRLQALRGLDGEELWRAEQDWDDVYAWPAGADLTGDGVDDLLVAGWRYEDWSSGRDCGAEPVVAACTDWDELAFTSTLGVRSGRDGSLAWSTSYPGRDRSEWREAGTALSYERSARVTVTNAMGFPYLSGDHDGDGGLDLVVNVVDVTWEWSHSGQNLVVTGRQDGAERTRFSSRAMLVSGRDGAGEVLRAVEDAPSVGRLRPADSAGASLLWAAWTYPDSAWSCEWLLGDTTCSEEVGEVSAELEMLDGDTLGTRWRREMAPDAWPWLLDADLTGDGHAEVFLQHFGFDADSESWDPYFAGEIVAGGDGSTLWAREGYWWPAVVPSLDGTPGDDVLVGIAAYGTGTVTAMAERIDGATGETLFATTETADAGDADRVSVFAWPVGDVTGDGVPDLGWEAHRVWLVEECEEYDHGVECWTWPDRVESRLRVEATRSAATLYEAEPGGYAGLWPAADLDGNGTDEVFQVELDWESWTGTWTALDVLGAGALWQLELDGWLTAAGDQTGEGADEVLLNGWAQVDDSRAAVVASLDGRTAAERWSRLYE